MTDLRLQLHFFLNKPEALLLNKRMERLENNSINLNSEAAADLRGPFRGPGDKLVLVYKPITG